ncbi:MAG: L-lactate permease [Frankiaceae bacterium]|nr:L-lactate permease [Frankiaceae bacterium]
MTDALAIEAAEAAVHCGYPAGAVAVLAIELDGPEVEVEGQFAQVEQIAQARHVFETRIGPAYFVQNDVIPRTELPEVLAELNQMADDVGLRVANVCHAGDGNLHPLVLFDDAVDGQAHDAEELAGAILELCISAGASITGEHGVGQEERHKMAKQFTEADLDTMQLVRCAFDPDGIAHPGRTFPAPRLCGEQPGLHTAADAGLDPLLLLAPANTSGGVLGKMISPQNLAIAAATVGMAGEEGVLFRKVFGWSIGFLVIMAVLIYLQPTSVLSWMLL